jgi:hypothetical protein
MAIEIKLIGNIDDVMADVEALAQVFGFFEAPAEVLTETDQDEFTVPDDEAPVVVPEGHVVETRPGAVEDVRAAFARLFERAKDRLAGQAAIQKILGEFGATKSSDLKPEHCAAVAAAIDAWRD